MDIDLVFQYHLKSEMKRSLLNKDLFSQAEFIVESKVGIRSNSYFHGPHLVLDLLLLL